MIPLSNMQTFDGSNPWSNVTFSRDHHGNKFKFRRKDNDNVIQAKPNDTNQHILLKQIIDIQLITKISIEFTIRNHIENSIIGMIKYPLQYTTTDDTEQKELDIKSIGLYGDKPLQQTPFCDSFYGIGTTQHIGDEYRKDFRIWRPSHTETTQITMDIAIKSGDKIIMVIDGRDKECKVYINEINDKYLICDHAHNELCTFKDLPQQFVVIYGSHCIDLDKKSGNKKKKIDVEVRLLQLLGNASQMKRRKKGKNKKNKTIKTTDLKEEKKEYMDDKRNSLKLKRDKNETEQKSEHKDDSKENNKEIINTKDENSLKPKKNHEIQIMLNQKKETEKKRIVSEKRTETKNVSETTHKKKKKMSTKTKKSKSAKKKHVIPVVVDIDIDIDYDWSSFGSKVEANIDEFTTPGNESSESSDDEYIKKRKRRKRTKGGTLKRKKKKKESKRRRSAQMTEKERRKLKKKKSKKRRKSRHHLEVNVDTSDEEDDDDDEDEDEDEDDDNEGKHVHHRKSKKRKKRKQRRKSARVAEDESEKLRRKKKKKKKKKRRHSHNTNRTKKNESDDEDEDEDRKYGKHLKIGMPNDDSDDDDVSFPVHRARSLPPPPARSHDQKVSRSRKPPPPRTPPPSTYLKTAHQALDKLKNDMMAPDECYIISKCLAIKRINAMLVFYDKILNQMFGKNDIIENYCSKYKHLLNDYHHILRVHLNGTKSENNAKFAAIYEIISDDNECSLKKCNSFRRNNRNRDDFIPSNHERLHFYIGILDTIHCLFMHSYDAGFRIENDYNEKKENDEDGDIESSYTDHGLKHLNRILSDKYQELSSIHGSNRMKMNKFNTDLRDSHFGTRFYYWDYYKDNEDEDMNYNPGFKYCDLYIAPKYDNLKSEILNNTIYRLEEKQYVCTHLASQMFVNTNYVRSCIKQETEYALYETKQRICDGISSCADELFYRISIYSKITIEHIFAIIVYTDYVELQMFLRNTFKRLSHRDEAFIAFKDRHSEFAHLSRLLRECIEIYGEWISSNRDSIFYCSISSTAMLSNPFCFTICLPMSLSSELSVISLYQMSSSSDCGFIFEISCNRDSEIGIFLKYFNCAFFSCSSFESEVVFCGGWAPITINSILCIANNHNYQCFIESMNILQSAFNAKLSKICANRIHYLIIDQFVQFILNDIEIDGENGVFPQYITQIFMQFIANIGVMRINMDKMSKSCSKLKKYFISPPPPNTGMAPMLSLKYLTKLCPQCCEISIKMQNANNLVNLQYLLLLAPIIKYCDEEKKIKLESIRLQNIGNQCPEKELNTFRFYLNTNRLKWSINIIINDRDEKHRNNTNNKYEYHIRKISNNDEKQKPSLITKMKGIFAQK